MEKPKDLIPENQMKQILKEVYVYRQVKNFYVKKGMPQNAEINLKILEKYNVGLEQFQTSYKYYLIDNAAYDEMLQEIKEELEAELPQDSIKKADKKG